jgi:hypothetical protein
MRLPDNLVRFCQLVAIGYDEETGEKLTNTAAAEKAGIGNSKDSARRLASHYLKDQRVGNLIERLREDRWQAMKLGQLETIALMRELADIYTTKRKIKRTIVTPEDGNTVDVEVYEFRPAEAERLVKTMAEITGLTGVKQGNGVSGGGESAVEGRELSGTERSARVIELLKRTGIMGTGSSAVLPSTRR